MGSKPNESLFLTGAILLVTASLIAFLPAPWKWLAGPVIVVAAVLGIRYYVQVKRWRPADEPGGESLE
ncbi:hypothetical protein [uncultured Tessaracoccus sp.]|uniref:hypothetical protein n=1 Tax=uncultured Tessaracoccus sp. TaxID=905023 RepID=UPI0025DCF228|nr:hypothetical protein [uncultured Tessaracoccus sp.]